MISLYFRAAAWTGTGALLVFDPGTIGLWSVVVTSAAGLVAQFLKNRDDGAREERRHRFDIDNARETAAVRASIDHRLKETAEKLDENTALTRQAGEQAAQAYDTANHVNEKIARIAAAALQPRDTTDR